jgi:hypothetical protein
VQERTALWGLKLTTGLFLLGGAWSLVDGVITLFAGRPIGIPFGVLGLPIGVGLLYHNETTRVAALIAIWLSGGAWVSGIISLALTDGPLRFSLGGGLASVAVPDWLGIPFLVAALAVVVFEYRVLTAQTIRTLFAPAQQALPADAGSR